MACVQIKPMALTDVTQRTCKIRTVEVQSMGAENGERFAGCVRLLHCEAAAAGLLKQ